MKIAMHQMIDWLDTIQVDYTGVSVETVLMYAKTLSEIVEKKQIIEAYSNGFYAGCDQPLMSKMPEKYYNETYSELSHSTP